MPPFNRLHFFAADRTVFPARPREASTCWTDLQNPSSPYSRHPMWFGIRRVWVMALVYLAGVFVTVKVAAAFVLALDGAGWSPFVAVLPGLWLDILLWSAFWAATYLFRRTRLIWCAVPLVAILGFFSVGSWTSFLVTHVWVTWQRLRGDENVTIGDLGQLGQYSSPAIVMLSLVVLGWVPAYFASSSARLGDHLARRRTSIWLVVAAAFLFVIDGRTSRYGLFGLSEQPLIEFVRSVFVEGDKETDPLPDNEWKRAHQPIAAVAERAPPTPPKVPPKNVILYLAEGISTQHTNFSEKLNTTPNLYRRYQKEGLWFDRYYTHAHRSIHSIFATLCSEYPPATLDAMTALHPRIDCGSLTETLDTLPDMHLGLFHGGRFSFANKLAFLGRRGFDVTLDAQDLSDPEKWQETWWGIDDRAVVDSALDFVDSVPEDERFFLLIIPISPHEPYDVPSSAKLPNKIKGSTKGNNKFLRAVHFADQAFERLMTGLETRGRYDDTLTIWAPDHGNHEDEPARPSRGKRMLYQHNVHVPLVMLHPGSFTGTRSDRLAAQIDLSPTITHLLGAPVDPRDRGQDLFSDQYQTRRIYLLTTRGSDPFVGVVDGDWKMVHDIKMGRSELYDLLADPEERVDVSDKHVARVRKYVSEAVRLRHAQRQTLLQVPALASQNEEAVALLQQALLGCGNDCPAGAKLKVRECNGKWTKAPCLAIHLPANEAVEIILPESLIGSYDSLRVRWWNNEKSKVDKAKLGLKYGDRYIPASPKWHKNDQYRVVPVPHRRASVPASLRLRIESSVETEPVLSLTEH